MNKENFLKASILSAGLSLLPLAQAAEVRLLVHGKHIGTDIVYHYTLVNNGSGNMLDFTIGLIPAGDGDNYLGTLTRLPTGTTWMPDPEVPSFPAWDLAMLDPAYVTLPTQPAGWTLQREAGSRGTDTYAITWKAPEPVYGGQAITGANAGQTLTGFTVRVPANSATGPGTVGTLDPYVTGNFRATVWKGTSWPVDAPHPVIFAAIEKLDTTPPTFSVTLSPNTLKPNEKLIPINATVAVKDDYDPQPEIKLESITANEPLEKEDIKDAKIGTDDRVFKLKAEREGKNKAGRIYTVTYSATDATGNKATASATVTVPHDERKKGYDKDERKK